MPSEEEIAREIDLDAFDALLTGKRLSAYEQSSRREVALERARSILALFQNFSTREEGLEEAAKRADEYALELERLRKTSTSGATNPEAWDARIASVHYVAALIRALIPQPSPDADLDAEFAELKRRASNIGYELVREADHPDSPHSPDAKSCEHARTQGSGCLNVDGSGYTEMYCMDCGKKFRNDFGPRKALSPSSTVQR